MKILKIADIQIPESRIHIIFDSKEDFLNFIDDDSYILKTEKEKIYTYYSFDDICIGIFKTNKLLSEK